MMLEISPLRFLAMRRRMRELITHSNTRPPPYFIAYWPRHRMTVIAHILLSFCFMPLRWLLAPHYRRQFHY